MKQSEKNILIRTMLQVSKKMPNVTLFRQDVGSAWNGDVTKPSPGVVLIKKARFVRYGLTKGSCDLIGWKTVEITPDMVGKKVAVFVGIEMKTKRATPTRPPASLRLRIKIS